MSALQFPRCDGNIDGDDSNDGRDETGVISEEVLEKMEHTFGSHFDKSAQLGGGTASQRLVFVTNRVKLCCDQITAALCSVGDSAVNAAHWNGVLLDDDFFWQLLHLLAQHRGGRYDLKTKCTHPFIASAAATLFPTFKKRLQFARDYRFTCVVLCQKITDWVKLLKGDGDQKRALRRQRARTIEEEARVGRIMLSNSGFRIQGVTHAPADGAMAAIAALDAAAMTQPTRDVHQGALQLATAAGVPTIKASAKAGTRRVRDEVDDDSSDDGSDYEDAAAPRAPANSAAAKKNAPAPAASLGKTGGIPPVGITLYNDGTSQRKLVLTKKA